MERTTCQGTTTSGQPCLLRAGKSGYCHIHDPEKIKGRAEVQQIAQQKRKEAQEKGAPLQEVISIIEETCTAKGWRTTVTNRDWNTHRYASISVERFITVAVYPQFITGIVDVSLVDGVKVSMQRTSGRSYGFNDLHDSIITALKEKLGSKFSSAEVTTTPQSAMQNLSAILRRFHSVAKQLRNRHNGRETIIIQDEYDVQDLIHALLRIHFDDVRPEEYTPSYAGGASRIDFLLKKEKIVVEVKMASARLKDKLIGEQLIIDTRRYQSHPDCSSLVCFIYDPGEYIGNPSGLEKDLTGKHGNMEVFVIIVPT